jgi:hypothetical protein
MKSGYRKLDVEDVKRINEAMIAESARAARQRHAAAAQGTVLSAIKRWVIRRLSEPPAEPAPIPRPRRYVHFTREELNAAYGKALRDMREGTE